MTAVTLHFTSLGPGSAVVLCLSKSFTHLVMFISVRNSLHRRIKEKAILYFIYVLMNAHPFPPDYILSYDLNSKRGQTISGSILCSLKKVFLKKY